MSRQLTIVVGLGNPGREYAKTRHNAGFLALDRFAEEAGLAFSKKGFHSLYCHAAGRGLVLVKPQTFMNKSGLALGELAAFYKVPAERWIVLHDELDLPPGVVRIKKGGGTAGHNGLASIVEATGESGFLRIRLGIGRPPAHLDGAEYVLQGASAALLSPLAEKGADALALILEEGAARAMNQINRREESENGGEKEGASS